MKVKSFKIESFRSIKSTSWLPFSLDGVTVLLGQNESGKSSILEALNFGFAVNSEINESDFRTDEELPSVALRLILDDADITAACELLDEEARQVFAILLSENANIVDFYAFTFKNRTGVGYGRGFRFSDEFNNSIKERSQDLFEIIDTLATNLWSSIPEFLLFDSANCSLPNTIDITGRQIALDSLGKDGAANFLTAADVVIDDLLKKNERDQKTTLKRASSSVSGKLAIYWSQFFGDNKKIQIDCELCFYSNTDPKSGSPYLAFWVKESDVSNLHPKQRSKGTQWFLAFFLEMIVAEKDQSTKIYLLDEPGAFLHPSAQKDVLKLLEKISGKIPVIYSTHSPFLIDQSKIERILAVERSDNNLGSDTTIRRGLELAASSAVTLAPLLALIGVDFSQQEVIRKTGNLVLEESSALFYLNAFQLLFGVNDEWSFIPANGATNVPQIVDFLVAWKLNFSVLVDDDQAGKRAVRSIKEKYHIEDALANKKLLTFTGCDGIEDLFTLAEFREIVAEGYTFPNVQKNSEACRGISKPTIALMFLNRVRSGEITEDRFSSLTKQTVNTLFDRVRASFESGIS